MLRQHFFGAESDEVWSACKTVGEMCNLLAMTYLQQEDFNMVLELLKKAEILTERDMGGRAATYNNLACYYRRQGKLHAALQYLQKVSPYCYRNHPCCGMCTSQLCVDIVDRLLFSYYVCIPYSLLLWFLIVPQDRVQADRCSEPCGHTHQRLCCVVPTWQTRQCPRTRAECPYTVTGGASIAPR